MPAATDAPKPVTIGQRLAAEFLGTFVLVLWAAGRPCWPRAS